jgi:hypothetical protein
MLAIRQLRAAARNSAAGFAVVRGKATAAASYVTEVWDS